MKTLIRTPLLANCLNKGEQNLFGFNGVLPMKPRGLFGLIMAALILTTGYNAKGQTNTNYLWNNSSTIYANASSWTNGVAPSGDTTASSNNIIQFSNFGSGNNTVSLSAGRTVGTILFSSTANPYTFESTTSTVRLSTMRGITNNSTATQTFNLLVDTKDNNTWYQAASGSMIFNTNVGLASIASSTARTLTLTGGGTFDFKAGMTGAATNTGTGGKLVVNNPGGTVNLRASNSLSEVTLTAGTLNINNNNALGTGVLTLTGGATIDNTSGSAVVNAGNQNWTWNGASALNFGSATNTAVNNLNLGTGTVTLSGTRAVNLLGAGTKLTIGDVINTGGSSFTANGTGNTLEMRGLSLSGNTNSAVIVTLAGTANIGVTGAIVNGQSFANGVTVTATGTTTLSGNNTYTGTTSFQSGNNIVSGDNSAAVGNVTIPGSATYVRLDNINAISRTSSLLGANATAANASTLDFGAAGDFTFNSFGIGDSSSATAGGSMAFTNSSGSQKTVTFTNANNYITALASANRALVNNSSNMTVAFDGNIIISSTNSGNTTFFSGAGNFKVGGSLLNCSTTPGVRNLEKIGAGKLTLQGASNNYSGSTLVSGGTLEVGAAGVLPVATSITVSNGATLRFNQASGGINVGSLTNAGTLEQNLITITSSGAVNLTGSTLKVNGTPTLASYTLVSGTSLTGTPTLNPSISDYALSISGNNLLLQQIDTTKPVITLIGASSVNVAYGASYTDLGATVTDNRDAERSINGVGSVNTSASGSYTITFNATDAAGNVANTVTRTVTVLLAPVTDVLKDAFGSANGMPQNDGVTAVPVITQLPNGIQQLTYTFDVKVDSALTVTYQTSTDLVTWEPTLGEVVTAGSGSSPTGFLKKQVQVTGSDRLFVRLNVTR